MDDSVSQARNLYPAALEPDRQESRDDNQIDLRAVFGVLRRRKWAIIGTFAFVVSLALLATSQLQKRYSAEALIVVDRRDAQLVGIDAGFSQGLGADTIVDTEVEIARSSIVLERAVDALDLANSAEFRTSRSWLEILGIRQSAEPETVARVEFADLSAEDRAALVRRLARTLEINRRGLTNVISIDVTAPSAQSAANWANAVADAYLSEQISARLDSTGRAVTFLRERVEGLEGDIASGEAEIDAFVSAKLAELGSPAAQELLARIAEETRTRQAREATLANIQSAVGRQDYAQLAQLAEGEQGGLAGQRQALVDQLQGSDNSLVERARARLEELDQEIRAAAQQRAASLQVDISLSTSRTAGFRRQLEPTLADLQLPNEVATELFRLQREIATRRSLYDNFLSKLREVEQQTGFSLPDSRVIAYASPPEDPSFPPTRLILAGAVLLSLGAGIGLAFLRENVIGGVTSAEQIENLANVPVVASVPLLKDGTQRADLVIVDQPLSTFSEAIRRIRVGIDGHGVKGALCVFVTSSLPGEGKTTIALSLARQFALTGSSTLLIDADLRHPTVHRLIGDDVSDGLIAFLSQKAGSEPDELSIAKETATDLHFVLGTERSMVATDALLMSSRFDDLMAFGRKNYDVIIVDTPPVGLVVDATIVARHCDVGVFVVRYAATRPHQVRTSVRDLVRYRSVPLCAVLNQVAKSEAGSFAGGKYTDYYGSST